MVAVKALPDAMILDRPDLILVLNADMSELFVNRMDCSEGAEGPFVRACRVLVLPPSEFAVALGSDSPSNVLYERLP